MLADLGNAITDSCANLCNFAANLAITSFAFLGELNLEIGPPLMNCEIDLIKLKIYTLVLLLKVADFEPNASQIGHILVS